MDSPLLLLSNEQTKLALLPFSRVRPDGSRHHKDPSLNHAGFFWIGTVPACEGKTYRLTVCFRNGEGRSCGRASRVIQF